MVYNKISFIKFAFRQDCKKHVKNSNSIFANWTALEKKQLGIGNLYSKHFADETYNAHRAVNDVVAMERLFTSTPLVSLLST